MSQKNGYRYGETATTRLPFEVSQEINDIADKEDRTRAYILRRLILKGLEIEAHKTFCTDNT